MRISDWILDMCSSYLIAGMRHSGSTALFNFVILALKQRGVDFASFYSEAAQAERLHDPDCPLLLIKTHEFRDDVASRASMVITTRRDLRDTVASAQRRKFTTYERLNGAVESAQYRSEERRGGKEGVSRG